MGPDLPFPYYSSVVSKVKPWLVKLTVVVLSRQSTFWPVRSHFGSRRKASRCARMSRQVPQDFPPPPRCLG